ncbi:hypothetical protein [Brazilian marseillevirus]|uniref:hypothetical protein n=1 Tax=Brazilian marseillevirus TaxID=1813599 RepID=UPI000783C5A2|nr:hypothetical protein A3303_gp356 [Brazilian marseillevirus]AMQ10864.1 hypothetical protein [Brazilian marseillevirus]
MSMEASWEEVQCELCAVCYETFDEVPGLEMDEEEKPVRLPCDHYSHIRCLNGEKTRCIYFCEEKKQSHD